MNIISYDNNGMECSCTNGCMSVLMTVIGLSGSELAGTDFERDMIVWLVEKDQSHIGIGTAGFDITEMPWIREFFDEQKVFMKSVLEGVMKKVGWETLDYEPNMEIIEDRVAILEKMFNHMQVEDIDTESVNEWLKDLTDTGSDRTKYQKCKKHGIYLSVFGCIACNDK